MEQTTQIYLNKYFLGKGASGIIFKVDYENFSDGAKKYIVKIVPNNTELLEELKNYNNIMNTRGIYKKMIPKLYCIPTTFIQNYDKVMKNTKRPKWSLLMEYLENDLDSGLCKNDSVHNLSNIYSCIPNISLHTIYPNIVDLVKTIASLNKHKFYHNDIKLENILLSQNNLYLVDFGLSFKMEPNHILDHSEGTFPDEIVYNYSVYTLRMQDVKYKDNYSIFVKKYIRALQYQSFDKIYISIYGRVAYDNYIYTIHVLPYISKGVAVPKNLVEKYKQNIDSFGLGIVMLYLYAFSGNKSLRYICLKHNKCNENGINIAKYLETVKLLLAQDITKQISPEEAYDMIAAL